MKRIEVGQHFGRWEVIGEPIKKQCTHEAPYYYPCRCSCENQTVRYVNGGHLRSGKSQSCGCLTREKQKIAVTKHGGSYERLFVIWNCMRTRCYTKSNSNYKNYGGRGIKVCEEWKDYAVFKAWAIENGYDPTAKRGVCTLDRIDVNGNYEPSNCRWVSTYEQNDNRRNTVYITYKGETKTIREWSQITGLTKDAIWQRYHNGWSPEEIIERKSHSNPINRSKRMLEHDGETHTIEEWAELLGMSKTGFEKRLNQMKDEDKVFHKGYLYKGKQKEERREKR